MAQNSKDLPGFFPQLFPAGNDFFEIPLKQALLSDRNFFSKIELPDEAFFHTIKEFCTVGFPVFNIPENAVAVTQLDIKHVFKKSNEFFYVGMSISEHQLGI